MIRHVSTLPYNSGWKVQLGCHVTLHSITLRALDSIGPKKKKIKQRQERLMHSVTYCWGWVGCVSLILLVGFVHVAVRVGPTTLGGDFVITLWFVCRPWIIIEWRSTRDKSPLMYRPFPLSIGFGRFLLCTSRCSLCFDICSLL